jgi:hypothetical protein
VDRTFWPVQGAGAHSQRARDEGGNHLGGIEETMEASLDSRERRRYPRVSVDLPLEFQDVGDDGLHGAMVVNAGEGGFLIESTRNMPLGTKLSITLLFPKGYELANFKAVAKIVRKEPYSRENSEGNLVWEGYRYGLEFLQILEGER